MIDQRRRGFLKGVLGASVVGLTVGSGLIPLRAQAATDVADWPEKAFKTPGVDETIAELYGMEASESDQISLDLPTIAQNGAVVPVSVETALPNVTAIALLVAKNPNALAAAFDIPEGTVPFVSNRLKMAETTDVVAVVISDGKAYKATQNVKVTVGGCGG
ncbi:MULTISPECIES: thiosulfate oxidation carrier protein SoxY [Marinobacter]|uniref:Thiosulfate oxidation carrier protein SoxY n=1 Tax=Marinobacter suaedae TaxID=3057675 RepID=A0ABT8W1R1_9GAMM|nr:MULTISPECIES: thiosulfate oxidation carrier protein SoxY [unclassified Marinobacter]MBZ2168066.1 thiosulfate oxidation carrier protein SoxY [Marinobacter sp. F4216]MDO3722188.1 thiosulfate oxidation carrier protein SoxY [Marinobacter sp. chi1]